MLLSWRPRLPKTGQHGNVAQGPAAGAVSQGVAFFLAGVWIVSFLSGKCCTVWASSEGSGDLRVVVTQ